MEIKVTAKKWIPSALIGRLKPLLRIGIYYSGNYQDWASASEQSCGYDSTMILHRVAQATSKVISGEAKYERDSMLFEEVQHSFPVLAGLLRAASENDNHLSVLDFGGSLGSSFYQCRQFLAVLPNLKWGVVEQESFVKCGKEQFETEQLKFYFTISECIKAIKPNVVLLSSVLQYLPDPYSVMVELLESGIPYIIIDRTVYSKADADRIAVQHVPASIYKASYPIRIFGVDSIRKVFRGCYEVIADFDTSWDGSRTEYGGGLEFNSGGMILHKI
jgi:putative methyltransferase (TIGR04325 family)